MKAILVNNDKSLSWSEVPDPVIKPDEVLVKIEVASLNRADLMQRDGDYPPPDGCPEWMGLEISGEILKAGDAAKEKSDWKIGGKVCALLGGGGYAQYVSVKYDMLMPFPKNCSMVEAAAIPEAFATAYLNLFIEGKIKEGNTLLMHAGARWIMIAALAGQKTKIDLKNICVGNVRIIGSTLRSRTPGVKAQILSELTKNVFPKIEQGLVKPTIYKVLPIEQAEEAHAILQNGQNVGKVVLTVNE